jgi:hypothetical protein
VRQSGPLETVAIVYSQTELAVLLSLLEDRGIAAFPFHRGQVSVQWTLTVALGGVPVQVLLEDADEARAEFKAVGRSWPTTGVYANERWLDLILVLLMLVVFWIPPPSRIPAFVIAGRSSEAHTSR